MPLQHAIFLHILWGASGVAPAFGREFAFREFVFTIRFWAEFGFGRECVFREFVCSLFVQALGECVFGTHLLRARKYGSRFIFGFVWFIFGFVCFPSWLLKCTYFTLVRQHHQHHFQHPPHVQPTSPASPANRGPWLPTSSASSVPLRQGIGIYVCMLKRVAGPCHDGKSEDSNTGKLIP